MSLKVVRLEAENFKRLRAVRVTPEGNVIEIAGDNGEGKTSLLDALWVALKGRAANPPEPIRQGEEAAYLELDLGKYRIVRRFTRKEDGDYTDFLRVEDPEGLQYPKPQQTLDKLLGAIGFDPFAFVLLKPEQQAASLLELVPLEVDLAELRAVDKRIYDTRRDVNRELKAAQARLEALPKGEKVEVPDLNALQEQLANAGATNGEIERRKHRRETFKEHLKQDDEKLAELLERIKALETEARELEADLIARQKQLDEAEPIPEPVDTAELSQRLSAARQLSEKNRELEMRDVVAAEAHELEAKSAGFTKRLEENEKKRQDALAKAKMPIEGLGVDGDDNGLHVTFEGVPFVQISKAEQLRVSTAIAMAANPELRILRISDGALLDDKSMAILQQMAAEHDFQLWIELVRPNESTGIIIEDGRIKGQELEPREKPAPKPRAKKDDAVLAGAEAKLAAQHAETIEKAVDDMNAIGTGALLVKDDGTAEHVPAEELFAEPAPKVWTLEEWNALPAARRAFLAKKGGGPEMNALHTQDGNCPICRMQSVIMSIAAEQDYTKPGNPDAVDYAFGIIEALGIFLSPNAPDSARLKRFITILQAELRSKIIEARQDYLQFEADRSTKQ